MGSNTQVEFMIGSLPLAVLTQRCARTFEFRWRGRWHATRAGPSYLPKALSRAHLQRIVGRGFRNQINLRSLILAFISILPRLTSKL